MPIHIDPHGVTLTGEGITRYRLLTIISGIKLEMKGLRLTRGVSCYALAKREFGFKGNRAKVLAQLVAYTSVHHMSVEVTRDGFDEEET